MGIKGIDEEYEEIRRNLQKMAEEELKEIDKRVNALEIEAEKIGKEAEKEFNKKNE